MSPWNVWIKYYEMPLLVKQLRINYKSLSAHQPC